MNYHRNNIGFIRLLLSLMVICGHAPEMIDGNRNHEPLTLIFHTLSLGEIAVDAFFIISGYLITQSVMKSRSIYWYAERRIFRIYPAFLVAYFSCIFILGPLVDADPFWGINKTIFNAFTLQAPITFPGQFPGLHTYPALNGSMWTIAYEFRCYIVIAILRMCGTLKSRFSVLLITFILVFFCVLSTFNMVNEALRDLGSYPHVDLFVGRPDQTLRLTAIFLIGSCFYLFSEEIASLLDGRSATICLILCIATLYRDPHFAEAGLAVFGGLALFWIAFKANLGALQQINDKWDISYGVYLYGWPVAIYLTWLNPTICPWVLVTITIPIVFIISAVSWWGLERKIKERSLLEKMGIN